MSEIVSMLKAVLAGLRSSRPVRRRRAAPTEEAFRNAPIDPR